MKKRVSVVIPVFNEETVVDELVSRLEKVASGLEGFELQPVIVDDGSQDATYARLEEALPKLSCWKLISLSRNFGLQAAYKAGLDFADGDAVVFMDGDLQDPPELIGEMVACWEKGAKTVVACRNSRKESGLRRLFFDLFHRTFNFLCQGAMPRNSGTFGLMDRHVADHVRDLRERSLFFPALRCWPGFETEYVYYDRDLRFAGETKQSFRRLLSYAWDGITSFSDVPLQWITGMGFLISGAAFLYSCVLLIQRVLQFFGFLQGLEVLGFTTIVLAVLFMGGVQLIAVGVVGTYISRIFVEVKDRPLYITKNVSSSE
ncbi:MAG: glycosyltransferase family 2 protein [Kiritimatiellales bacterium]|nr:glycosyltransferase family 2 protein [Kiritimatiellales bacterium]